MAEAIVGLWGDAALRARLVENEKQTAQRFTGERASGRMEEILAEIADAG